MTGQGLPGCRELARSLSGWRRRAVLRAGDSSAGSSDPHARMPVQAQTLMRLVHEFYIERKKYDFVYAFNHAPSTFDFKRLLDSMGHDSSELPR